MPATEDTAMSDAPTPQTPTDTEPDAVEGPGDAPDVTRYPAGTRTSGNVELLVLEAELVAAGTELDNPARPADPETVNEVMAQLDEGVRPAWAVIGE